MTRSAIRHYGWIGVLLLIIHGAIWWWLQTKDRRADPAGSPAQKAAYYAEHCNQFDLLWVGDSRAYCGLHPRQLDPLLGTCSLNMASFAHWLPTQYPAFQELVPTIRPGTKVVWSVGVGSFHPAGNGSIQNSYPVGLSNVPRYLNWGYSWEEIEPNVRYFATNDWPGRMLAKLNTIQQRPCWQAGGRALEATAPDGTTSRDKIELLQRLLAKSATEAWVATVEVIRAPDSKAVTSIAIITDRGAYCRYEIDPAFFRRQQQDAARELRNQPRTDNARVVPNQAYWSTFVAMLELFRRHQVDLIVNEIPEAPFVYENSRWAVAYREFLRQEVRSVVEEFGFTWISADVRQLSDDDFFDQNHLNSQGIEKYAQSLASVLKPEIGGKPLALSSHDRMTITNVPRNTQPDKIPSRSFPSADH